MYMFVDSESLDQHVAQSFYKIIGYCSMYMYEWRANALLVQ